MSRVIKFRAWDKWHKKMIAPNGGDFIGWHAMSNWKDCLEVMQFTSLTDRNGVEIFEGDILKFDGSIIGAITFEAAEFIAGKGVNARALCALANVADEVLEVVGNIHENPELLEATQ